jgi:RNA polymerase sigma-70 factor (ECF subfamily)
MVTDYGFFRGFHSPASMPTLKYMLNRFAVWLTEEDRMGSEMNFSKAFAPCTLFTLSDSSLVVAAQSGVHQAYVELCLRHREMVFRTVHRITRNLEDAEDVLQESWMRGFMHIRAFDGRSAFSTWLTRIAINAALMLLRKRRSVHEYSLDQTLEPNHPRIPEIQEPGQNPEERSIEDIAAVAGISVAATKSRLLRAKVALRRPLRHL